MYTERILHTYISRWKHWRSRRATIEKVLYIYRKGSTYTCLTLNPWQSQDKKSYTVCIYRKSSIYINLTLKTLTESPSHDRKSSNRRDMYDLPRPGRPTMMSTNLPDLMSHGTRMDESWHTYGWVMTHIWMSHGTHMNESWHTYEWVMAHIWMSHGTHMNKSWHTYEWVMAHI